MSRRDSSSRAQQAGIVLAAAETPLSFQKTLMLRSDLDQGLVTGMSMASNYGIGVLVQEQIETLASLLVGSPEDDEKRWRRLSLLLDLVAIGGGAAVQRAFAQKPDESLKRASIRTAGFWVSKAALAGFAVGALQALLSGRSDDGGRHSMKVVVPAAAGFAALGEYNMRARRRTDDHEIGEWKVSGSRSVGIGTGVGLGVLALSWIEHELATGVSNGVARVLPGSPRFWKPAGHLVSLGAMAYGVKVLLVRVYRKIEATAETIEPAYEERPQTPLVSGSAQSVVDWDSLSRAGRRNVATALGPKWIQKVVGEKAKQPIRVFTGIESADTEEARVQMAIDELDRTGAFKRGLLMVISPTGTGYANYVAIEATEYMTRGDMATVVMQYSMRPSPLSLDRVDEGRHLQRQLVRAIHERLKGRKKKPRVVLFGESLGAWTSQDPYEHRGTDGLQDVGVERALWIGTPHQSKWKQQVLRDARSDVDRSLIGVFNDFEQLEMLPEDARAKLRFVMITHDNDAVASFWLDLLVQAPSWLGKNHETRPKTVPKNEKWSSPTTFWQTAVDMKNAANVVPGDFEATGHDYRKDLAVFIREVYALDVTDDQLADIETALREFELKRASLVEEANAEAKADKAAAEPKAAAKPKAATRKPRARKEEGNGKR